MTATDAYTESFGERGSKYDRAMRLVADSRKEEFMAVVEELAAVKAGLVLDVPAGGGYLRRYLPERFVYKAYEPVGSFKDSLKKTGTSDSRSGLLPFPQDTASVDIVVSVAGVHHFADKLPLFIEMARVAKPDGKLVLADVHQHSPVASFLDGYIGKSNSSGHDGIYLCDRTLEELDASGWHVESARRKHYHWVFNSQQQMLHYCHLLFDICHDDFDLTLGHIERELGVDTLSDNQLGLRWDLCVITAEKKQVA